MTASFAVLMVTGVFLAAFGVTRLAVDSTALAAARAWRAWGESHQELNRRLLDLWAAAGHTPHRCGPCGGRPCRYVVPVLFEERGR